MRTTLRWSHLFCSAIILLSGAVATSAQVPQLLNYQGRIAVNGTNFTGTGQFKFALVSTSTNASVPATASGIVSYGFLVFIAVNNGGSGYSTPPAVTITDSTGTGAAAYAQISGGVVTNIVVTSTGAGYSSSPSITIAAAPLQTTLWSNDGTSSSGGQPTAGVPLPVTKGLYSVLLGDTTLSNMAALPASVFTNSDVRLRVWFNDGISGFQQLAPDQRLAAVGYAIMAGTAQTVPDGSITTSKIALGAVGAAQIAPGSIGVTQLAPAMANGLMTLQVPNSTNLQANANTSYFFTNASANQLTLPANPNVGDRVRVAGGAGGFTLIANAGQSIFSPSGFLWTPLNGGFDNEGSVAISADGSKVLALTSIGTNAYISASTNCGASWFTTPASHVGTVAMSADGSKMVAGQSGGPTGFIYISSDYGLTWSANYDAGLGAWGTIAISADGSKMVAGQSSGLGGIGYIFTSTNYGVNWIQQNNAGQYSWSSVAISADGSKILAGHRGGYYPAFPTWVPGFLSVSTNYGVNWSANNDAGSGEWYCGTMSADGSKMVAAQYPGYVYTSANFGVNWTRQIALGSNYWQSVAMSADGSKIIVANVNASSSVTNGGFTFVSTNYGITWTKQPNIGSTYWSSIAMSADGSKTIAGQYGGNMQWIPNYITQWSTVYVNGDAYANMELVYMGNNLWSPAFYAGSFTIR